RMKMKRDNHDDGPHSDKRSRRNDDQVRILIPSNIWRSAIIVSSTHTKGFIGFYITLFLMLQY
ncbi:hypothetical protein DOY81_009668, partial [Sarcophaga bullata]